MARRKKRRVRDSFLREFIADWGVLPGPLDYETYVGLVMYGQWAQRRKAYFAGLAHSLADSVGEVPLPIVAAACDDPKLAQKLAFDINADRAARAGGL